LNYIIYKPLKVVFLFIFRNILLKLYRPYFHIKKAIVQGNNKLTSFKYIDGALVITIFVFIIFYNLNTKYALAEDLGKKSLLAQVISTEFEEEIVEGIIEEDSQGSAQVITEASPIQSGAIQIKDIPRKPEAQNLEQTGLTESASALIKPNLTGIQSTSTRTELVYYEVQTGDNIGFIAEQFNLKQSTVLWANQLSSSSLIKPGDKLVILPTDGVYHQVTRGETISSIARKYQAESEEILDYNQLADASAIQIGEKLIIPGGKMTYSIPTPTSLGSIKQVFSAPSGTISTKGFIWPSTSRRITQYYNWRHTGLDIGAKTGTPIISSKAGRVERAGWSTGYGYNIIVDHGGGVQTLYAHASKLYVERGNQVQAGQTIGAVGSTGWSTGPHIHYEIRINGVKVNPLSYL